jgi:hypothetical protein
MLLGTARAFPGSVLKFPGALLLLGTSTALLGGHALRPSPFHSTGRIHPHKGSYDEEKNQHSGTTWGQVITKEKKTVCTETTPLFLICAATGSDRILRYREKIIREKLTNRQFFQHLRTLRRPVTSPWKPWTWRIGVVAINYLAFELLDHGECGITLVPARSRNDGKGNERNDVMDCKEHDLLTI